MGKIARAAVWASAFVLCAGQMAVADGPRCAAPTEYAAMQTAAMQMGLMDAALTCGRDATDNFNALQIRYSLDLRRSDGQLLTMFQRFWGEDDGFVAYDQFKTDLANLAELARVREQRKFCNQARHVARVMLSQSRSLQEMARVQPLVATRDSVAPCSARAAWMPTNTASVSR